MRVANVRSAVAAVESQDNGLADQLRRAGTSVVLNVAESKKRVDNDRAHLFRIAAGRAEEVRATLTVATGCGYITDASVAHALELVDQDLALLWGLTHREESSSALASVSAVGITRMPLLLRTES